MNIGNKLYLKDIEDIADDSHLKLRVLKIWNFIKNNQGTKYQSPVFNQNFSRFRDLLKEGIGQAQSHFDVTKMFINSDIVEINEFKKELKADNNGGMSEKSITTLPSYSSSYIDDFKGDFPLKTVCEVTEPLKAGDSLELFPNQMNVLKNRKFAFLVDITAYNVTNYNNIYTVVKLTEDVSIVSELESKLELMSVQSVPLNEVPLESDDVVQNVQKDVISQTDESFTPSTADKSSATSPMKISGDLKRNLHDIYDVDGGGDLSSTKSKRISMGEGNPLLVPKVEKYPSVVRLPFHLPNQQHIVYGEDDDIDDVLGKPSVAASKFTAWMECNAINSEARELTYVEFPTKFVWVLNGRFWKRRKIGKAIGRIHSVSPNLGEAYFLRILLNKVKGPTSFDEICTVNGETYSSFRDTCYALGLLDDDKEYIDAIKEAKVVWENTWEYLADGILYNQRQRLKSPDLSLGEDEVKNLTLFEIEQILLRNNSTLKNFTKMPYPDVESVSSSNNRLIIEELDYDIPVMKNEFDHMFLALTNEQRNIFLNIMSDVKENKGGVFFVYGYGGMGKTFLWKTISAAIRSDGNIVLNVASSGIAPLLLPGGRTAHSRFILPFELTEDSFCKINPDGDLANLLRKTSLIIWDESPMIHKHAFEALDRTLKDVLRFIN
ncbi:unnamed protein product [Lactuca virosa]|uniref:ATP-dependent DNA helicase n=1 Tax=Lactuca virosa TaxID=75947 RepID=A0AAU9NDP1_9ASTR|nr:unnamed protein product [Lactuca virosa]